MADKPEFIQLEAGEDAASVRDRLTFLRGQRVLLIWPEQGTALTRRLDLVLVQREAVRLAIRLALVTHDPDVIRHAQEIDLSTFETVGASERARWKRGRSKVFTTRLQKPEDEPEPDELAPVASRLRPETMRRGVRWHIMRALLVIVVIALLLGGAYVVIPGAEIALVPDQSTITVETTITAVTDAANARVDVENAIIPAITIRAQIESRAAIPTTGTRNLSSTRAIGSVVFINRTASEVRVPFGTIMRTSAGSPVSFRTTVDATVPAGVGLQIEVPIEATEQFTGAVGNVESGQINVIEGELTDQLEVRNINPTSGGEDRAARVVSADDRERLIAQLRQDLQARAFDEMQPRLEESQFIIPETVRIVEERSDWMTFDHEVGDVAEELSLNMRAVVEATAIDEQSAQQVVLARLSGQIPRGYTLRPETILYERGSVTTFTPDGGAAFSMNGSGLVTAALDLSVIQRDLAGRTLEEAQNYLQTQFNLFPGAQPTISLQPTFIESLGRLPLLPPRIRVRTVSLSS